MKQAWKWAIALGFAATIASPAAAATILADFAGGGATGTALGPSLTVSGVTAESGQNTGGTFDATDTNLFQRNVVGDRGIGVCSVPEVCIGPNGEIVELDAEDPGGDELIRLSKPDELTWESVWLSSLDGAEAGNLYWSDDGVNFLGNLIMAYQHTSGPVEQQIFIPGPLMNVRYLIFQADPSASDTDHYVWRAELNEEVSVPEPTSLALLGLGLLGLTLVRRRS